MRWPRVGPRRLLVLAPAILMVWSFIVWESLPYDNPILLLVRFASRQVLPFLRTPLGDNDNWVFDHPPFPVRFDQDVGFIVKTGYGTQTRIPAQLDALDLLPDGSAAENLLVIADFAAGLSRNGHSIEIHDSIAVLAANQALTTFHGSERLLKYNNLTAAIKSRTKAVDEISRDVGWELDAMKFVPGLEMAYKKMPSKKWYVMVDDDTYILKPSLGRVLGHMDHSRPMYTGNAVGDYKGRFAHGGSGIVLSQAAMAKVFGENSHLVSAAYVDSLTEAWGDKVLAEMLMRAGIYLDERYSHFFNGERPRMTRIRGDRVCSPIVSFHGLAGPGQMEEVGRTFRGIDVPITWGALWKIYGQPGIDDFIQTPTRPHQDYVGRTDESTMSLQGVTSAGGCLDTCVKHHSNCLAWTWDESMGACHISPWMIIGEKSQGKLPGSMLLQCRRF
ncbi:family 31 glycosyltransferase [Diplogelasinospora grovesii]|uniref:N-acetylgalactosaminide beta-1,3-galactosyltransferase n=1 Tax=Diplogelasinospora grovesii TaxID=303347 RepID=A0AAN6NAU1_9PEZI|nr:family 31 glycosyltransferase [Diplogelasinospora grovesii]